MKNTASTFPDQVNISDETAQLSEAVTTMKAKLDWAQENNVDLPVNVAAELASAFEIITVFMQREDVKEISKSTNSIQQAADLVSGASENFDPESLKIENRNLLFQKIAVAVAIGAISVYAASSLSKLFNI